MEIYLQKIQKCICEIERKLENIRNNNVIVQTLREHEDTINFINNRNSHLFMSPEFTHFTFSDLVDMLDRSNNKVNKILVCGKSVMTDIHLFDNCQNNMTHIFERIVIVSMPEIRKDRAALISCDDMNRINDITDIIIFERS